MIGSKHICSLFVTEQKYSFFRHTLILVASNVCVFALMVFVVEAVHRFGLVLVSCNRVCDYSHFLLITGNAKDDIGISSFHPVQGYAPTPYLVDKKLSIGSQSVTVNTSAFGIRRSSDFKSDDLNIITIGDSFTWGDQVSDHQTWQSCLNSRLPFNFINGGVFGYGTTQSMLRAKFLSARIPAVLILYQVLVGHDFQRNQLDIRSGFVKPSLQLSGANLVIVDPPSPSTPNTKYGPKEISPLDFLLANLTFLRRTSLASLNIDALALVTSNIDRRIDKSPSLPDVIDWTARQSAESHIPFVWLLQYESNISRQQKEERMLIVDTLNKYGVKYVDTYDELHGPSATFSTNELWQGHHTPLGNRVVCNVIESKFSKIL